MHEFRPPTILLVDDCPANRRLCEKILQQDGLEIVQASNGQQAIDTARTLAPHVIIMGAKMPVMGGLEATRILRAEPSTRPIPIIIVSVRNDEASLAESLAAGANEYVCKPIRAREFRLRVRSMVHLRQTQMQVDGINDRLQRRAEALAQLNHFSENVLTRPAPDSVLRDIVTTAGLLTGSGSVCLFKLAPHEPSLEFACRIGTSEGSSLPARLPLNHTLVQQAMDTPEGIAVIQDESRIPPDIKTTVGLTAKAPLISILMRFKDNLIGLLTIGGPLAASNYPGDDLEAIRQFSRMATLAMNNVLIRQQLDETRDSTIFAMAKLSEYRHQETGKHLERVRELSTILAQELTTDPRVPEMIDPQFINDIRRAAPLHDLGKVAIPDSILLKPEKLDKDELQLMQKHTSFGAETLRSVIVCGHEVSFLQMAMDIAHYHHEHYDGNGYPEGLAGEVIPLCARIVALADAYDAIRTCRVYKPARNHEDAVEEILRASGTQFDPLVVRAFRARSESIRSFYDQLAEQEAYSARSAEKQLAHIG